MRVHNKKYKRTIKANNLFAGLLLFLFFAFLLSEAIHQYAHAAGIGNTNDHKARYYSENCLSCKLIQNYQPIDGIAIFSPDLSVTAVLTVNYFANKVFSPKERLLYVPALRGPPAERYLI